jgi:hypothetical protein
MITNSGSLIFGVFGRLSTAVIQRLLEHSSPDLTNKVYMNVDPVLRYAIDSMPAGDWLRIRIVGKRGKNVQ